MTFPERWEEFTPELRDMILQVSRGELTAEKPKNNYNNKETKTDGIVQ